MSFPKFDTASKIHIIDTLTVNQSTMTERMDAPKSGASRKISHLQKTAQIVATAVASLSIAHAEPTPNTGADTKKAQTAVQAEPLAAYKLKVAKMTEEELRAESDTLAAKIQPMIDANASDEELLPYLTRHDAVHTRLDPIISENISQLDQKNAELDKEGEDLDFALKVFADFQELMKRPEKIDLNVMIDDLQQALAINKKYNPELYVQNEQ